MFLSFVWCAGESAVCLLTSIKESGAETPDFSLSLTLRFLMPDSLMDVFEKSTKLSVDIWHII